MSKFLLYLMALGAVLGGIDHILGNRFGLGRRFEEAFHLLGPMGLSMAGILCLAPLLSGVLGKIVVPVYSALGLDPGMLGSVLAIDMGGYQMAMELAADPQIGRYCGIVVSAIFGCTVVFTIPMGMAAVEENSRPFFVKGILLGLGSMPVGLVTGGIACGLPLRTLLWQCLPIFVLSALLIWGLWKNAQRMVRIFRAFARGIRILSVVGLTLGAVQYMTELTFLPEMIPLTQAMEVVCSIAIVMLGSMPLAELLQRMLKVPLGWIGKHTGLNSTSTTGLLIGLVSVMPALAMVSRMDRRGKVVCGAAMVCGASAFAAHLGFALSTQPDMAPAMLWAKLLGAAAGVVLALAVTQKQIREDAACTESV